MPDRFGRTTWREVQEVTRGAGPKLLAAERLRRQLNRRHLFNGAFFRGGRPVEILYSSPDPWSPQHTILVHADGSLERKHRRL